MNIKCLIICGVMISTIGCSKSDKFSGKYNYVADSPAESGVLEVVKDKNSDNYKFIFNNGWQNSNTGMTNTGELDFITKIDNSGKSVYSKSKDNFGDYCELKMQFFNDDLTVEQDGMCGAGFNVSYRGKYSKTKTTNTAKPKEEKQTSNNKDTVNKNEQKVIFIADSVIGGGRRGNVNFSCSPNSCNQYAGDINSILSEGWKIVSSHPKEIATGYENCVCSGTEYVIGR